MVNKALLSVSDKEGIVEFAKGLIALGWQIVSTGGTAKVLRENGIQAIEVSELTHFPECLDGRVKTLHPIVEGGILAQRSNPMHQKQVEELGIELIDIVVCNLYPFKKTINSNASHESIIENIDIGGPTMIRSAAKNYESVTVLVDAADYSPVLDELKTLGKTRLETRERLATKVFTHTAHYDALISAYFNQKTGTQYPETISLSYERVAHLRYGENPHQSAAFYKQSLNTQGSLANIEQLHGKELSYNNINDSNGALETLKEFEEPTVVAVKHGNPCGVGSATSLYEAYLKAYKADPVSIFGGIVVANREVDEKTATEINQIFIEVLIAPTFTEKALAILTQKKNIRILKLANIDFQEPQTKVARTVLGGLLIQDANTELYKEEDLEVVTTAQPTPEQMEDLKFAWKIVKHAKSNGIVLAKGKASVGVGPGQVSRIWALENAIRQGGEEVAESVLASDAFFPFPDCVEAAHRAGIKAIIQPGGSIKDKDSIEMANKCGIAMVFTKKRHFKH